MVAACDVSRVAIVGTGVIGAAWAAVFHARGYIVTVFVRSKASDEKFGRFLQKAWAMLVARGLATDPEGWRGVTSVTNIAECVASADYVQESVIEELALKMSIIAEIDAHTPPGVIVGTSSSFIPLSLVRYQAARDPARIATVHPTLPQWDSFVEVIGSTPAHTSWLVEFFGPSGVGMDVITMRKECYGHVLNASLSGLISVSTSLVSTGVTSAPEMDRALVHMAQIILASGGMTGALVGMIGGGTTAATLDLSTDIMVGMPAGIGACLLHWVLPPILARPFLAVLAGIGRLLSSATLKKGVRRLLAWWLDPIVQRGAAIEKSLDEWSESATRRMSSIERLENKS